MHQTISPHKTWLGAVAGFLASVLTASVIGVLHRPYSPPKDIALLGAVIAVTGQFGDLYKSVFKRYAGVKDSGALLPGHGGLLDRMDSVLLSAPLLWFLLVV